MVRRTQSITRCIQELLITAKDEKVGGKNPSYIRYSRVHCTVLYCTVHCTSTVLSVLHVSLQRLHTERRSAGCTVLCALCCATGPHILHLQNTLCTNPKLILHKSKIVGRHYKYFNNNKFTMHKS